MMNMNRFISLVLILLIILTVIPVGTIMVNAESNVPSINVDCISTMSGKTIEICVRLENNPGILGATLELDYGEGLTLINASQGDAWDCLTMTKPGKYSSPCRFVWDGQEIFEDQIKDGVILTLTFDVSQEVEAGASLPITISYNYGDVIDDELNPIELSIKNGKVDIIDYTPGDLDGDNTVNTVDVILLRRYIAGGYDVEIDTRAANVNLDKKVNTLDVIMIRRFIAGGYEDENGDPLVLHPDPIEENTKPSDWVLESEVPTGATIFDNKWTYKQRETVYRSSNNPPDGYTLFDVTWEWGPWGSWSGWSENKVGSSDSRDVQTRQIEYCNMKCYCCGRESDGYRCYLSSWPQSGYTLRLEIDFSIKKSELNSWEQYAQGSWFGYATNVQGYIIGPGTAYIDPSNHTPAFIIGTYNVTEYRYRDRSKVYTYLFERYTDKESTTDPTGQEGVTDVKHWVKYKV